MEIELWKLGGSLFDLPDLKHRVNELKATTPNPVAIIAGGGSFADAARKYDSIHQLSTEDAHQVALESMKASAQLAARLLSVDLIQRNLPPTIRGPIVVWNIVDHWSSQQERIESIFGKLVCDWTLTSDSIAASIAALYQINHLRILKSVSIANGSKPTNWASSDLVDPQFPKFAKFIPQVSWVNLREFTG